MNLSLLPSLEHLSCTKVVTQLFNDAWPSIDAYFLYTSEQHGRKVTLLREIQDEEFENIKNKVMESIAEITPSTMWRKKLEKMIASLFCEIEDWLKACNHTWEGEDGTLRVVLDSVPHCWSSDGTIDREKSVKMLLKSSDDVLSMNRFVFACTYCVFDDVFHLWQSLGEAEKQKLKQESHAFVRQWMEWLESWANKDWQFFIAWILGTPLWKSNLCVLKRVWRSLSPGEKRQYLPEAISGNIDSSIMHFFLSVMTGDEREQLFRESPLEVFKCISSRPLRRIYFDLIGSLWPHITENTFLPILSWILEKIGHFEWDYGELLVILNNLWERSPDDFKDSLKEDARFDKPLQFVFEHDPEQAFPREKYLDCYTQNFFHRARPNPVPFNPREGHRLIMVLRPFVTNSSRFSVFKRTIRSLRNNVLGPYMRIFPRTVISDTMFRRRRSTIPVPFIIPPRTNHLPCVGGHIWVFRCKNPILAYLELCV